MITTKKTSRMVAACASLCLVAAACGSDADDAVTTDAPIETDAPVSTDAPAATDAPITTDAPVDTEPDEMMDEMMEDGPFGPACSAVPEDGEGSFAGMTDDPAATAASNNPLLSTLVTAVTEAGLVDTLNSDGPFTIFAPANPAFDAFTEDELNGLLADVDTLTSVLTLHVVAGEQLSSADLAQLDSVTTVNGADITLAVEGDTLVVNGQANVGCADIMTANATVHVIDAVLLP